MRAIDVARYIIKKKEDLGQECLSNLELQKTLYFAQLNYYKEHGQMLIDDDFEAWRFGPVIRDVYDEYCHNGADDIRLNKREKEQIPNFSNEQQKSIQETIDKYKDKDYWQMVKESHKEGGAWKQTYQEGEKRLIDKELIKKEAKNKK